MVAVRYVDVGPEHVFVADLDKAAGVDHDIPVEVVAVPDSNPDRRVAGIARGRPKPATLSERVVAADLDLRAAPDPAAALDAVALPRVQAEQPVQENTATAHGAPRRLEQQVFKTHDASSRSPRVGFQESLL